MKILLIDIDSKIPNLALKKIEKYHLDRGDEVIWNFELSANYVDRIYASCVFSWNKRKAQELEMFENAIIGGSGYDITKALPPEIEEIKPHINLGFTTKGCIRHCEFCIVPMKEGKIKIVGDIYDLWDGKSQNIILLDNNILATKNHFITICQQLLKENLKVDFNQGLDIRLVDEEVAFWLGKLKYSKQLRFSWDTMDEETSFHTGMKLLAKHINLRKIMVFMITGFNTTFEEDMYRLQEIRKYKADAFVMLYNYQGNRLLKEFARWNNRFYFRNLKFEDYLKARNYEHLLKNF